MKNVLVVDDEPDILEALVLMWTYEQPGFRIRTALSGKLALEAIAAEAPDLVLSDHKMPGMDGVELLRRVRELLPKVPMILMTAHLDSDVARRAKEESGANLCIAKPFNIPYVESIIQAMLGKVT